MCVSCPAGICRYSKWHHDVNNNNNVQFPRGISWHSNNNINNNNTNNNNNDVV